MQNNPERRWYVVCEEEGWRELGKWGVFSRWFKGEIDFDMGNDRRARVSWYEMAKLVAEKN